MSIYPVTKELVLDFMEGFFGYGNLQAPYWFIGKEEGGGIDLEENYRRILTWENFGKPVTVDFIDYHINLGFTEHQLNKIQSTWTKLIQILLTMNGKKGTTEERRVYQRHDLGRLEGSNCCLELMPMASRSTGKWLWENLFRDYYHLNNREEYFSSIAPIRIEKLKKLIQQHTPRLVFFYSTKKDYIQRWEEISEGKNWHWIQLSRVMKYGWYKQDSTLYIITTHPTMKGITNENFSAVGEFIKKSLDL